MSVQKLLAGLSSKITRWIDHLHEKKLEETKQVSLYGRLEGDWYAERPESWYKGPLIFLEETEEGLKEYQTNQQHTLPS